MKLIPKSLYKQIQDSIPIVCVDAVISNSEGNLYLKKRYDEPFKNLYSVIGGRVFKEEPVYDALMRHIKDESGLEIKSSSFKGYFDAFKIDPRQRSISLVFKCVSVGKPKEVQFSI